MNTLTSSSSSPLAKTPTLSRTERSAGALLGLYVADATAMPVHWMYNLAQLRRDYGTIRGFVKPKDTFEGSIMNLSNTGGGGRGSDHGDIIGQVINHNKKQYWRRGGNYHYHLGLEAGENTLECQLCRLLTRSIVQQGHQFSKDVFLNEYVQFMTTPSSHNDTYASTAHRMFFANYIQGKEKSQCADNDGHNVDAIDALTLTVPVILTYQSHNADVRNMKIREVISATRKSTVLQTYAEHFADLLVNVLSGEDLRQALDRATQGSIRKQVAESRGRDPMTACYIDSAYPALLHFAYKYAESPEEAILANANAGGENVARGALLGALLGAAHGVQGFPKWAFELEDYEKIQSEIDALVSSSTA
eukprot:gene7473-8263_t